MMDKLSSIKVAVLLFCSVGLLSEAATLNDCSVWGTAELYSCNNFTGEDPPSPACCGALTAVDDTQPSCLCELAGYVGNASVYFPGFNLTRAIDLPGLCNITVDWYQCSVLTSPTGSAPAPSPNSSAFSRRIPSTILSIVQVAAVPAVASLLLLVYTPAHYNHGLQSRNLLE